MDYDTVDGSRDYYATTGTRSATEVLVSTSIRLPQPLLNQVRDQATVLGIPATTLMRQWVTDKATTHHVPAVVSVAELQHFITGHTQHIGDTESVQSTPHPAALDAPGRAQDSPR